MYYNNEYKEIETLNQAYEHNVTLDEVTCKNIENTLINLILKYRSLTYKTISLNAQHYIDFENVLNDISHADTSKLEVEFIASNYKGFNF